MKKILIVGLGNPILGDDGIGWHVAEMVKQHLDNAYSQASHTIPNFQVDVECLAVGGLSLMEQLDGYDRALIIDAMMTGNKPISSISIFDLEDIPDLAAGHLSSVHDTSLQKALQVGRTMGVDLPEEITIIGIETNSVFDFSEELTPALAAAVPQTVQTVLDILYKEEQTG
jgi:hydrogenase maturation protease